MLDRSNFETYTRYFDTWKLTVLIHCVNKLKKTLGTINERFETYTKYSKKGLIELVFCRYKLDNWVI